MPAMLVTLHPTAPPADRAALVTALADAGAQVFALGDAVVTVGGTTGASDVAARPGVAAALPLAPDALGPCRAHIDAIDAELLRLLEARLALALCIGEAKRAAGLPVHVPEREADVIARAERDARLDAALAGRLFSAIVAESREAQRRLSV